MHFQYLLTLWLSTLAVAYTTVNQVLADITVLDDGVKALIQSTQAYTGGLLLSQGIDFAIVEARLIKLDADGTALPPTKFSTSDTQALVNLVARTLAVDNPKAVNVLKSKKNLIEATPGQGQIVKGGLQALLAGHLEVSEQFIERTPADQLAEVEYYVNIISNALEDGINAFSS